MIAASLLLGGQPDPVKRRSLRTWAWSSAAWLVVPAVIVIALFAWGGDSTSRIDRSGPCVGGPQLGAEGKDVSGNGTKFVVPCSISGTATVSLPNKSH